VAGYRIGDRESISDRSTTVSWPAVGPTEPPCQWLPWAVSAGVVARIRSWIVLLIPILWGEYESVEIYLHSSIRIHGVVRLYKDKRWGEVRETVIYVPGTQVLYWEGGGGVLNVYCFGLLPRELNLCTIFLGCVWIILQIGHRNLWNPHLFENSKLLMQKKSLVLALDLEHKRLSESSYVILRWSDLPTNESLPLVLTSFLSLSISLYLFQ
jgi:hypothetical protein